MKPYKPPRPTQRKNEEPLSWLDPKDGPAVVAQAWKRLTVDDYDDVQRDPENHRHG